jgi:hypothetical protein
LKKWPAAERQRDDSEQDGQDRLHGQFLRALVAAGKITKDKVEIPTGMSIPYDITGKLDVDCFNPGPVLSPVGQMTMAPHLSMLHGDDKRRIEKDRQRGLNHFPLPPPDLPKADQKDGHDLWEEREQLTRRSSLSSVSDVSQDHSDIPSRYSSCSSECWLSYGSREIFTDSTSDFSKLHIKETPSPVHTSSSTTQIYQPLSRGQTRILCLQSGLLDDPIISTLSPITLSGEVTTKESSRAGASDYEALSYTWGDPTPAHKIECNGCSLPVARNLFSALKALRYSEGPRLMWIDAICINQSDVAERNEQVQYMTSIYRAAVSVLVWLGEGDRHSDFAIQGMQFMSTRKNRESIFRRAHKPSCIGSLYKLYQEQSNVFQRPWFRRSWIRQEVSTAKKVIVRCGEKEVSWNCMKQSANRLWRLHQKLKMEGYADLPPHDHEVFRALKYLRRGWSLGKPLINPTGDIRSIWYYHAGGILDLLMVGREFDATDPRDKVYSILGISEVAFEHSSETAQAEEDSSTHHAQSLTLQQPQRMRVDYSASISEVYQYIAKHLINRDLNLDILCILSTHRDENSHDLPTWTPDWRVPTSTIKLSKNWHYFGFKYAASGFTKAIPQDQSDLSRLTVQGFPIDQILGLYPKSTDPPHIPDDIGFNVRDFKPESDLCVLAAMATERQICLVPTTAEPGDLVFILHGAKVPFVLRQVRQDQFNEGSDEEAPQELILKDGLEYEVVGPCWIPEEMWGQAIKDFDEKSDSHLFQLVLV